MDTNKLAALLQMFAGSGDCEQILKEGAGVAAPGGFNLEAVSKVEAIGAAALSHGFIVQINGQRFMVEVYKAN